MLDRTPLTLRGGLSGVLTAHCDECRALTSVGEACEHHAWIFDRLNDLEARVAKLRETLADIASGEMGPNVSVKYARRVLEETTP